MQTIVISGASGFVGTNLIDKFTQDGFKIIKIQRNDLQNVDKLSSIINGADIVINLAGANIINRWSKEYKEILYHSRIDTTKALVDAMEKTDKKPKLFISTSAVGIYANKKQYDEEDFEYANDFLSNLCQDWENEALKAKDFNIRTAIFRFGIVMGHGGALAKMLLPFKLGLGGTIGDGKQAFSYIHIDDLVNAYSFIINNQKFDGVFNLTAPTPTTNYGLTKALGTSLHRPTILPIPEFVLNIIFSEGAKVLTDGQSVLPKRLLDNGFEFKFKTIEETVDDLTK